MAENIDGYITAKDILSFNFYTYGQAFCGSYRGMRYRIKKDERELPLPEGAPEGTKPEKEKYFSVAVWPEPFAYDVTDEAKIVRCEYPFNKESYEQIVEYLNGQLKNYMR